MNDLQLQLTPVEVAYQSKDPVSLSCIFKKVVISTGHLLEKHEIKSNSQMRSGKASFTDGPVFSMSKDFQLNNTKISLHFFAKKDRNISCIGSAEIDVATLPNQSSSMIEVKLDNCNDPKAKIKLEVQRKQSQLPRGVRKEQKRDKMELLSTEGQRKEEMLINRRANPNFPTAYEISRRNYKQVQINCHEDKKTEKKSTSSKKSTSYQKRHYALNTLNATNKSILRNEERSKQSPMPRRQTPQPIQLNGNTKMLSKYGQVKAKENSLHPNENRQTFGKNTEEAIEQPQFLKVKPYPEGSVQNIQNCDSNGFQNLQDEKNNKYRYITEKLQKIHDKIATSKDKRRLLTEQNSQKNQESYQLSHQYNRSCLEKSSISEDKSEVNDAKSEIKSAVHSFNPLSSSQVVDRSFKEDTPNILSILNDSPEQKDGNLQKKAQYKTVQQKFQKIKDMKDKSPSASPSSQKTISYKISTAKPIQGKQKGYYTQLQSQSSKSQLFDDKQIALAEIEIYKKEIEKYKKQLVSALKNIAEKDKYINEIEVQLETCQKSLKDKQSILSKLNDEYEREFEKNFLLQERIAELEGKDKREESLVGQLKISELSKSSQYKANDGSAQIKSLNEEIVKGKKRILQVQSQLKFKQNENKCLLLQIDNIKREKRNLQQEIQILVSKDKNQMTRKASLARIEQINTSSLTQHTKRENEALKSEVKILLQKLQALNSLFQSFVQTGEKPKVPSNQVLIQGDIDKKYKILEQKCTLLQQQLKRKKNETAEIINLIWKHQSGDLMNEVFALITESS